MLVAAAAAGPWPGLGPLSLLWRAPIAVVAVIAAWPRLGRRAPWVAVLVAAGVAIDVAIPARLGPTEFTARAVARSAKLQGSLAALAEDARLRRILNPGGGEAEPEAPFPLVAGAWRSMPIRTDALVVVDGHGLPVAWAGPTPRLPVHLRPLGERTVAAEPGIGTVWVWWRENVFENGRSLGAVLAGTAIPEAGAREALGVRAGRSAVAAPVLDESGTAGSGVGSLTFEVHRAPTVAWSAPGLVVLAVVVVLAIGSRVATGAALCAGAVALLLMGRLEAGWWLVAAVAGAAIVASRLPHAWPVRGVGAVTVGGLAWALPRLFDALRIEPLPASLLWPGALRWVLVAALAALVRGLGARPHTAGWPLRAAAWIPLVVGVVNADAAMIGAGAAAITLWGLPGRGLVLPALVAAGLVVGGEEAARKAETVATTEATLARLDKIEAPARALLTQLPEDATVRMVSLQQGERLVVLGRLANWLGLAQALPGTSLVLTDPAGELAGSWGEVTIENEGIPRELATRILPNGWRVSILAPPSPSDLLAGLDAAGIEVPVAVVDRSGAPRSRGATFRPLSPAIVGRALAAGHIWADVGIGEREFAAYLRAHRDSVLVVPWVRPPMAEAGLLLAALTLWGVFPLAPWERRRRWLGWWGRRRTFGGRLRVLSVAAAVLPILLLGQLLPRQWARQQQKARLELARAVSQLLSTERWEEGTSWLVRELGGAVAVYRSGKLVSSTRPDLAAEGRVPWLPPPEAYVRSVRGWREPLVVMEGDETGVFAPMGGGDAVVVGVVGLRLQALGRSPSPREWFVITGIFAMLVGLGTAERLGGRLGRPLRRLVGAARRLERGEPVATLETGGDEDVQALGRAFTAMAHEVQRREEELRRGRDLLETVLGTLSAAVVVVDRDGNVGLSNPAATRLLAGERTIAGLADRFAPEVSRLVRRAGDGTRAEGTVHPVSSPESLWRVTALPLPSAGGRALVVMEDLSDVARAERLASLAELARIAAHEVKNPLTPIRLWAEELKTALASGPDAVTAVAQVAAQQILERVEHLREVAQSFSNLVSLEQWEPEPIRLRALAAEVAGEYEVLRQRGVVVRVAGDDAEITADAQWIRRALRHLLENSARVLAGRAGEVVISVTELERGVVLSVRDTGGGVASDLLGRLFEPHFSTTSEGSGLGLAVVRRVAERAGGAIEARNVGGGLEIRITFPQRTQDW
ncbi:MAG TPA: ATP-binding protein [Thermoanaerobaculaceae bacterium]|nr:ATP-binding protein [Thermoanaerobaculaceae bacterium]